MRILYDHQVFSLQNAGGATRYFYELMRYFATLPDVQMNLWAGINATIYPFHELASANTRIVGYPGWLPAGTLRFLANEAWINAVAPFRGKMDVYHPTTYVRSPMVRAKCVVATHQDCTHERFPELFPDVKKVLWARKALFPRVDAIICASESSRQDLLHFYNVDPAKTCVIHHGLSPLPRSPQAAATLRSQLRRDYILYVGMRAAFKNFDGLLHAFRDSGLSNYYDLLTIGGGPLSDNEQKKIAGLNLSDAVICLPRPADEVLAEAYAGAKLFVYPSLNEGFGFPPLEAMSLDCPVLASRTSSIPEVCLDAPFYFDPKDEESFRQELLRAIQEEPARTQAILRGREVAAGYSWTRCGQETMAVYRDCQ